MAGPEENKKEQGKENFGKILEEIQKVAGTLTPKHISTALDYEASGYRVIITKPYGTTGGYEAEVAMPATTLPLERLIVDASYGPIAHNHTINGRGNGLTPEDALRNAFEKLLGRIEILKRGL